MTFKDLKIGDKVFVVNEEKTTFGRKTFGIKIETRTIKKTFYECDDLVLVFDEGFGYIDKTCENSKEYMPYFVNLQDAQKHFLKKEPEVYSSLVGEAAKYLKKYNDIVEIMNNISEERDKIETELIINGSNLES